MSAVWVRFRAELRFRRRPVVGLALLFVVGVSVVTAAAAAARRTDSAYARFGRTHLGADVFFDTPPDVPGIDPAKIARLPQVSAAEAVNRAFLEVKRMFVPSLVRSHDPMTAAVDRFKIIEGRAADPRDPREVVISLLGRQEGLRVGDTFTAKSFAVEPFTELAAALEKDPITMRMVGVAAAPGGFPPQVSETSPWMYLSPAFFSRYPNGYDGAPSSLLIRLKRGPADLPAFEQGVTRATGIRGIPFSELERRNQDANVQRSFRLQALALWMLAGLAGLAFVLILSQTLARQVFLDSDEYPTLSVLGMSRGQLFATALARVGAAALAGAALSVPLTVALSIFSPIGLARTAEPSTGLAADWTVLGLALPITVLAALGLAAVPAWRATAAANRAEALARERAGSPSAIVRLVTKIGAGPSAVAGVRLALERGRGRTAVPVRTSIAGVWLGVAVLAAAATFGVSLHHLIDVPRLYGVPWDMVVTSDGGRTNLGLVGRRLVALPEVRGVSVGRWGLTMTIKGKDVETIALDPAAGTPVLPPVLEGHAPSVHRSSGSPLDIVLGTRAMRRLHLRIGQVVPVRLEELDLRLKVRVVGRGVLPSFNESTRLGDGAWISFQASVEVAGVEPTADAAAPNTAFLDLRSGTLHIPFLRRMASFLNTKVDEDLFEPPVATASDVVNFGRVRNLPEVLGGILALFATATLAHTLVTGIRRRRRDLAILKTLGFVRGQVRRAVAVHGMTVTMVGLALGLPTGVGIGRWLWTILANQLGIVSEPVVPLVAVLLAVPAAFLVANLIAALPARAAARTQPAVVLRSE